MADTSFALKLDTRVTERAFQRLRDRAPRAIVRALNRAGVSGATLGRRLVSRETGITQADLKGTSKRNRRVWSTNAAPGHETVRVYASLKRIPLADFKAKGPGGATGMKFVPSRGRGAGVSWRIGPRAGRAKDLFIARMQSGHIGVFGRAGAATKSQGAWSKNLPIVERFGPSVAHVWMKHAIEITTRAVIQLRKNLASEFRFALGKASQGGND
jgi:hypothetical protein